MYFETARQKKAAQTANVKWAPWSATGSGASGICVLPHSAPVTRASYFRRRCARRRVLLKPPRYVSIPTPHRRGRGSSLHRHHHLDSNCNANGRCERDRGWDWGGVERGGAVIQHSDTSFKEGGHFRAECSGASPRRSRRPRQTSTEARGFPCKPVRDARSAEWELMSPLSLTWNVREHGFQSHHYPQKTTVPT
ncbi:hypothetical protein LMG24238_04234 [Paraburkholderia sediminicola]|uniref:Uncharacterized protein n=1 Tax=Paraburkholderia sediminicola TaxID=458836 RepID=A0A6J5BPM2_9BURK|nr:hypothetical protein LMG24238_04234 [Paraburkholderia sediminicola]